MLTVHKYIRRQNRLPGMEKGLYKRGFVKIDLLEMRARSIGATVGSITYEGQTWNVSAPEEAFASSAARGAYFLPIGEAPVAFISTTMARLEMAYRAAGAGTLSEEVGYILANFAVEELEQLPGICADARTILMKLGCHSQRTMGDLTALISARVFVPPYSIVGAVEILVAMNSAFPGDNLIGAVHNMVEARAALICVDQFLQLLELIYQQAQTMPALPAAPSASAPTARWEKEHDYGCYSRAEISELSEGGQRDLSSEKEVLMVKFLRRYKYGGGGPANFDIDNMILPLLRQLFTEYRLIVPAGLAVRLFALDYSGDAIIDEINTVSGSKGSGVLQELTGVFSFLGKIDAVSGRENFVDAGKVMDEVKSKYLVNVGYGEIPGYLVRELFVQILDDHQVASMLAIVGGKGHNAHPSMTAFSEPVQHTAAALNLSTLMGRLAPPENGGGARKRTHEEYGGRGALERRASAGGGGSHFGGGGGRGPYEEVGRIDDKTTESARASTDTPAGTGAGGRGPVVLAEVCWPFLLGDICKKPNCEKDHVRGVPGVDRCPYKDTCRRGKACRLATSHLET